MPLVGGPTTIKGKTNVTTTLPASNQFNPPLTYTANITYRDEKGGALSTRTFDFVAENDTVLA